MKKEKGESKDEEGEDRGFCKVEAFSQDEAFSQEPSVLKNNTVNGCNSANEEYVPWHEQCRGMQGVADTFAKEFADAACHTPCSHHSSTTLQNQS